jgi:hypothetical protein
MNTFEGRYHGVDVANALNAAVDTAVGHLDEHLQNRQRELSGSQRKVAGVLHSLDHEDQTGTGTDK